ncbi:hypothetical protein EI983_06085 [Roseovarius faecimaris]|uniref:Phosphate ABC transporter substrate-binding protein n=1 Tax=Roseovarius faecimaris TaxID=2494550 RepID=A0A6I6IRI2_9RHOB|nr:PhnD/SsuA/transferrin family substrate-binding protein [Roseovarius faecimaris]QGX97866.1 hypothetical protein EI983_06085 [Roseovarius faecimaris]
MIASLPMYDPPPLQGANDRFWQAIRAELGEGPEHLTRGGDLWEQWRAPDLVLSQTCGYPYRARLHGHVTLVGTPDYGLPGCPPGYYTSVMVVRAEDTRDGFAAFDGARFAFNEPLSQSGWAGPQVYAQAEGVSFGPPVQTGGHALSARAVAAGKADIAGIDALTWEVLQEHDPVAQELRVVARTQPTPVLPYITASSRDAARHFNAVSAAIAALAPDDRALLHLRGLVAIPAETYLAVPSPPPPQGASHLPQ